MSYLNSYKLVSFVGATTYVVPHKYMRHESYKVTINHMDLDSTMDTTGLLHRNPLVHTRAKIEFNVPTMIESELMTFVNAMSSHFLSPVAKDLNVRYYDPNDGTYKTGHFYLADPDYTIVSISGNTVTFGETRIALIEY